MTLSSISKIVLISSHGKKAILAQVVEFDTFTLLACRTSENTPRGVRFLAMTVLLSVIGIDFVGSRHLVFN